MRKLLYITDKNEYTDHSFIGPLFQKYLNRHLDIDTVFFSKFKHDTEVKEDHSIIVPQSMERNLFIELEKRGFKIKDYAFIFVRNSNDILKYVLKNKKEYNYKVGFRLSFPKRIAKIQSDEANDRKNLFDILSNKIQTIKEVSMINECDIFLPTSEEMKNDYFKDVKIKTFVIPSAIDPEILHENIPHDSPETRFFYAGTLDKLREFETVLESFNGVNKKDYKLMISTKDPGYLEHLVHEYPDLKENIEICEVHTRAELIDLIALADVGLAVLPDITLFSNATPVKVLDYYTSALPCVMTDNAVNKTLFEDKVSGWFTKFDKNSIKSKIEYIISLSKDEVTQVGVKGQERLLDVRNYEKIANELAKELDHL